VESLQLHPLSGSDGVKRECRKRDVWLTIQIDSTRNLSCLYTGCWKLKNP